MKLRQLFCLVFVISNTNVFAQSKYYSEVFSSFSWSTTNTYSNNSVITENGKSITNNNSNIGFGSGNEFGLIIKKGFDSSSLTLNLGISGLSGKRQQVNYIENKDSLTLSYDIMSSSQFNFLAGIGYIQPISEKLWFNTDLMLVLPVISRLKQISIYEEKDFNEKTTSAIKTNFLPGFNIKTGLGYKIHDNISLKLDLSYTFLGLFNSSSKIKNHVSSDGTTLKDKYPDVYSRETKYVKNFEKIKNDAFINPSNFDSNKPSDKVRTQLPYNRIGISASIIWEFNIEKKKDN